jgi:hypothetical protein
MLAGFYVSYVDGLLLEQPLRRKLMAPHAALTAGKAPGG